jgi:uncharacterized protein with NRDE domain
MCTLALYFREFKDYPLIVAANRDEYFSRPSAGAQVLLENPLVLGGKDLVAGGTWLGVNEHGLLTGIVNRKPDKEGLVAARSRGLLCLDILRLKDPVEACAFLQRQKGSSYLPFNLLFANDKGGFIAYNLKGQINYLKLERGLHVLSNTVIYDNNSEKIQHAYLLFSEIRNSLKGNKNNRSSWISLLKTALSDHSLPTNSNDPKEAICVHTESYGTVSSTAIFYAASEKQFYSFHAPGPPCREDYGPPLAVRVI